MLVYLRELDTSRLPGGSVRKDRQHLPIMCAEAGSRRLAHPDRSPFDRRGGPMADLGGKARLVAVAVATKGRAGIPPKRPSYGGSKPENTGPRQQSQQVRFVYLAGNANHERIVGKHHFVGIRKDKVIARVHRVAHLMRRNVS